MKDKILYEYLLNQIYQESYFNPFHISEYLLYKNKSGLHYEAWNGFINDDEVKGKIRTICEKDYIINDSHRKAWKSYNTDDEKVEDMKLLIRRDFYRLFTLFQNFDIQD